ncbi:helix-turn-helix domain-containing protein [Cohnella fermenti]|uniref:helix-turn-helix domain-containing protein n=1 Tax=Cohnella fermenti TaxID=2565925 RepID=UPI001454BAF6|nr:helix-turn-helix domain-containing protein [Cohnella fermenti]
MLYQKATNAMKDNAIRYNMAMLEQMRGVMDSRINEVDQLAYEVTWNPKLQELIQLGNAMDESENAYKFLDFASDLWRYKNAGSIIDDFYVYIASGDTILTPTSKLSSSIFYDKIHRFMGVDYAQWKSDLLTGYHYKTYGNSVVLVDGLSSEQVIPYTLSLPLGEKTAIKGQLVILINVQQIQEMINKIEWASRGSLYVINDRNEIILTTAAEPFRITESQFDGESGMIKSAELGRNQVAVYTTSQQSGWKYVSVIPVSVFLDNVNMLRNWALSLLGCCFILGSIIIYLFAYRQYNPIKKMVRTIQAGRGESPGGIANEYDYINHSILHSLKEESRLRSTIDAQVPVIRANFLGRLIRGYVDRAAVTTETLAFMDIHLISNQFMVLLIDIDDCSQFIKDDSEREWVLIRFVVSNLIDDLTSEWCRCYTTELDKDRIGVLLNLENNRQTRVEDEVQQIANKLVETIHHKFKTTVTIAVSSVHTGLEGIRIAYLEALKAVDYRILLGHRQAIHYNEVSQSEDFYSYPIEIETQIVNFVKSGDYDNVESILNQHFIDNVALRQLTPELAKCLFYDVIGTLVKVIHSASLKHPGLMDHKPAPIKRLSDCGTFDEMLGELKEYYRYICEYIRANKSDRNEQLMDNIDQFIRNRYMDGMLGLNLIAEQFQLTPSYLSTLFKKQTGKNVSDYIAEVRIEKSKDMLADSALTITQIAHGVGYANDIGFIRMFKKYEGVTPGKYRANLIVK